MFVLRKKVKNKVLNKVILSVAKVWGWGGVGWRGLKSASQGGEKNTPSYEVRAIF